MKNIFHFYFRVLCLLCYSKEKNYFQRRNEEGFIADKSSQLRKTRIIIGKYFFSKVRFKGKGQIIELLIVCFAIAKRKSISSEGMRKDSSQINPLS